MNLTAHGYRCYCAYDGKEAADLLEENTYDLVLLDIMLPEIDGYELLEYVKYQGTPVIFVTAKGTLEDKIKGLRMGADDYLVKPFQIGELIARVEAVLRRAGKAETEITLFGVTVNTDSRTVKKDEAEKLWRPAFLSAHGKDGLYIGPQWQIPFIPSEEREEALAP